MNKKDKPIRIGIVEDDPRQYERLKRDLEYLGCTVVVIATTIVEIINDLIPRLNELGITFIFLDNSIENPGDGRQISEKVREISPDITLVGFSSSEQDYVDVQLGKTYLGFNPLREALGIEN